MRPRKVFAPIAIDNIEEPTLLEMAITIGEKLRLAREERGISLRDISEQTRISMRYLQAIETDDYKRLPGGIFNRSFIKSYARYIGFDEKEAIEAYATTLRQKGEPFEEPTTLPKSLVYTDANSTRSPLVTLLLAIIILGVLSLGAYAALHWYQRRTEPRGSGGQGPSVKLSTALVAEGSKQTGEARNVLLPGKVCSSC